MMQVWIMLLFNSSSYEYADSGVYRPVLETASYFVIAIY
jgi:hypothetical protein